QALLRRIRRAAGTNRCRSRGVAGGLQRIGEEEGGLGVAGVGGYQALEGGDGLSRSVGVTVGEAEAVEEGAFVGEGLGGGLQHRQRLRFVTEAAVEGFHAEAEG